MTLLIELGFDAEMSVASLTQRLPSSVGALGAPTFVDDGYRGTAIRATGTLTTLFIDAAAGVLPSDNRLKVKFRLRTSEPKNGQAFLTIYKGGTTQLVVYIYRHPTDESFRFSFVVPNHVVLYHSEWYSYDAWHTFSLSVDLIAAGASLEWSVDDLAEARLEGLDLTTATVGWSAAHVCLLAESGSDYVDLDDLLLFDGVEDFDTKTTFDSDTIVDAITPIADTPFVLPMTPVGAASVTDAVDDAATGVFDGGTTYAQTTGLYSGSLFQFSGPEHSHRGIRYVVVNLDVATTGVNGCVYALMVVSGSVYGAVGLRLVTSTTYARHRFAFSVNPMSGRAWTPKDVNSILFGPIVIDGTDHLRVSQVFVEIVCEADPEVVAPSVPPSGFPAPLVAPNWRDGILVETTFQTGLVVGQDTATEDRRSLQRRPTRAITQSLTGFANGTGADVLTALIELSKHTDGVPFPFWLDRMVSTAVTTSPVDGELEVEVSSTAYRRLAVGQRILLSERVGAWRRPDPDQVTAWTLHRWTETKVYLRNGPVSPPTYPKGSLVLPCIDAEVVLNASVSSPNAKIVQALNLVVAERPGEGSLPPLAYGLQDQDAEVLEGAIIFPFKENIEAGVSLNYARHGEFMPSGKAYSHQLSGDKTAITATLDYTFLSRAGGYDFLSFVEALKGRAEDVWIPLPIDAWTLDSWTLTTIVLRVPSWFNEDAFMSQPYERVGLLFADPSNSARRQVSVVTITNVSRVDDLVTLTISGEVGNLSDEALSFRPLVRMRLSSDVLQERWLTDEILQVTLSFTSVSDAATYDVDGVQASQLDLVDLPEDLFAHFDAGTKVYAYDKLAQSLVVAEGWPSIRHRADAILDARALAPSKIYDPLEDGRLCPSPCFFGRHDGNDRDPWVSRYERTHALCGRRVLLSGQYLWGPATAAFDYLPKEDRVWWSNRDGMTIVACFLDAADLTPSSLPESFLVLADGSSQKIFEWNLNGILNPGLGSNNGRIRLYNTPGSSSGATDLFHENMGLIGGVTIVVFRWDPASAAQTQFFKDGVPASTRTASSTHSALPIPSTSAALRMMSFFDRDTPAASGAADNGLEVTGVPGLFGMMIFKRALSNAEINEAASYYKKSCKAPWTDI
jgi:hypothetical protein